MKTAELYTYTEIYMGFLFLILVSFTLIFYAISVCIKQHNKPTAKSFPLKTTKKMTEEVDKEIGLSYQSLVDYLIQKYGKAKGNYYNQDWTRNKKISRTSQGLLIHHIDEDKVAGLSSLKKAKYSSYDFQKADRLVYCNYFEHLLLHIKIAESTTVAALGIEGALTIIKEIESCYINYPKETWKRNLFRPIANDSGNFVRICNYYEQIKNR